MFTDCDKQRLSGSDVVGQLRNDTSGFQEQLDTIDPRSEVEYPIEKTIVIERVPYDGNEDVLDTAYEIICDCIGIDVYIVRAKRQGANRDRDGVIKVELENNQVVRDVLRRKSALRNHDNPLVRKFFVRQSKCDLERKYERNLGAILKHCDPDKTLRICPGIHS